MKLGVFDSGLGGLLIAKAIRQALPLHDMLYLGDTLHLPYGNRSENAIYQYTLNSMEYLFRNDCQLIIMACNTASASALRKLQQGYLKENYPDRRILGVIVPTIETAIEQGHERIGLIGTNYTVASNVYREELQKINPAIVIEQTATPLLVPLIEYDGLEWVGPVLDRYIAPLVAKGIQALILSCTHYGVLKDFMEDRYNIPVIAQNLIIPAKLEDYFRRHPEIEGKIDRQGIYDLHVSDITPNYNKVASEIWGDEIRLMKVDF